MSIPHSRLAAVLGPTNTGKTHYAIERMLARRTGVIGLPLRLLAREVYDKVVCVARAECRGVSDGRGNVSFRPAHNIGYARSKRCHWILARNSLQLMKSSCAPIPPRGHIFTDRLLNMRGTMETLFLGAYTMRKVIGQLIPKR